MKGMKVLGNVLLGLTIVGTIGGLIYVNKRQLDGLNKNHKRIKGYYDVTYQWVVNKQKKQEVSDYFTSNQIKRIAIYGMGALGELFYNEVKNSSAVKVDCFIDQAADLYSFGFDNIPIIDVVTGEYDNIDAVVVTPVHVFDEVEEKLREQGFDKPIVSLNDVINWAN